MFFSLLLLVLFAAGFIVSPAKQRRPILLSALFSTPFSTASIFFVPEYWNPIRTVTFFIGPEDLIFSFATGGIAWLLATWLLWNYIDLDSRLRLIIKRYLICILLGATVSIIFLITGLSVMTSTLLGILSVGLFILWSRRGLWPIQLIGMISFTLLLSMVFA